MEAQPDDSPWSCLYRSSPSGHMCRQKEEGRCIYCTSYSSVTTALMDFAMVDVS